MKIFNFCWNNNRKTYYYIEIKSDNITHEIEHHEKIKRNEPIKKFVRWFDKFNLIQTEDIDPQIIEIINKNFTNIDNITSNDIKSILKNYKLNKFYKMIPSIYCFIMNSKFFIPENIKLKIKVIFTNLIIETDFNFYINYNFFLKKILAHFNETLLSNSIPCINSLEKKYEYTLLWKTLENLL